jgi:alcohol dehydrogenase (NADP+)
VPCSAEIGQVPNGITADVEVLPSSQVDTALDRLRRNDVRYRFVLDMADLD